MAGPARRAVARLVTIFESEMDAGRGFLWIPVAFAAGIAIYFAWPHEPSPGALVTAGIILTALSVGTRSKVVAFRILVLGAALMLGAATISVRTLIAASPMPERETTAVVSGWVAWVDEGARRGQRLHVRIVEHEDGPGAPQTVRVTVNSNMAAFRVGDAVRFRARLIPPSGPLLPGGFDFARHAYYAGHDAVGFTYGAPERVDLGEPPLWLRVTRPLGDLREAVRRRVEAALPGDTGEIAAALITGDRGGISAATQDAMRASGLGHILAISGLHMALVAGSAFWILRAFLALIPPLALRYPIRKWAAALALMIAAFYLALSGAGIATQRAFIMLSIMLLAILFDRRAITLRNVALAALVIMLLRPESLLSASFQMSFAATAALVAAYEAIWPLRERRAALTGRSPWRAAVTTVLLGMVFTSLIAGLATAPFGVFHFQRMAPLTLLANVAAMPAVALVVMPMALLSVLVMSAGLEQLPLMAMGIGLNWVTGVATWVAGLSGDAGLLPRAPHAALVAFAVGFAWLIIWRRPWRLLGVVPMVLAGVLAALTARPDVLVDAGASAVAVRGADGAYSILRRSRESFVVRAWLRSDGDGRAVTSDSLSDGVACDRFGCTARIGGDGALVAYAFDDYALAEDCRLADIVITRHTAPQGCHGRAMVIDEQTLAAGGAHAIYRGGEDRTLRIEAAYPPERRPFMRQRRQ